MIAEQIKYNLFAGVAERQTRTVQVRVVAILCGFKSHLLHTIREEWIKGLLFFYVKTEIKFETKLYYMEENYEI